ncbi:ATP-binding protein [Parvularcula sp. IMCC14364]|uniref:ATP-binding protein n=1 Tax=Parvularcula sp. IMCC14364 TaxID=3067902 RepID=UPI002740DFF8|nr:ATP-binding protein [Parvularcula sp. IMCC14364]
METGLDKEIAKVAEQVRRTDFMWAAGLSGGACGILATLANVPVLQAVLVWMVILMGLAARYYTANVNWSVPVQRAVQNQLVVFQRLRAVMNALPEPVIMLKGDGVVEMANPATAEFVGTEPEGKHMTSIFRAPAVMLALEDAVKSSQPQVTDFVVSGSVDRHCRIYVTPLALEAEDDFDSELIEDRMLVFVSDLSTERRLEQMRSDFIANASHELRTPLASMLGFIETLRGHAREDKEVQEKFLGIMQSQAERMLRLVTDLMSLSSIELNEHMPPETRVDLVKVAEEVRAALSPVAGSYEGTIEVQSLLNDGTQIVEGDRDELIQVVQNLTDNALKYSQEKPKVTILIGRGEPPVLAEAALRTGETAQQISARAGLSAGDLVFIQIRDEGGGIRRQDLPRLTERFYRVDVEESKARGGTGLGLAIVKHIINRHKGGLQIESASGQGSAFTCFFRPSRK